jgi:hypothetical protein
MTEEPNQTSSPQSSPPLDSEIGFRGIIVFTVGLLAVVVLAAVGMWILATALRDLQVAQEPPPPALPEARLPYEPPGPRLQADPVQEMRQLRAEEIRDLTSFGWVDEPAGVARIPIERAMELLVERGIPQPAEGSGAGPIPDTSSDGSKAED